MGAFDGAQARCRNLRIKSAYLASDVPVTYYMKVTEEGKLRVTTISKKSAKGKVTKIKNATKATYTVPTKKSGTTYYYCVVTNKDTSATGKKTATKTTKTVTVTVKK